MTQSRPVQTPQGASPIPLLDCDAPNAAGRFTDDTDQFAELNGVKAQSVRKRYAQTGSYFGIRPLKLANRRLKWPHTFAASSGRTNYHDPHLLAGPPATDKGPIELSLATIASSADGMAHLLLDWELAGILNTDVGIKGLAYMLREHAHNIDFDVVSFEAVMCLARNLGMNKRTVERSVEILRDAGYVGTCGGVHDKYDLICVNRKLLKYPAPVRCEE